MEGVGKQVLGNLSYIEWAAIMFSRNVNFAQEMAVGYDSAWFWTVLSHLLLYGKP